MAQVAVHPQIDVPGSPNSDVDRQANDRMAMWPPEEEELSDLVVGVSMPNLAEILPMLRMLPEALEPLLHFLGSPETPETEPSSPEALRRSTMAAGQIPQLLPPASPNDERLTVVLDLDETLV